MQDLPVGQKAAKPAEHPAQQLPEIAAVHGCEICRKPTRSSFLEEPVIQVRNAVKADKTLRLKLCHAAGEGNSQRLGKLLKTAEPLPHLRVQLRQHFLRLLPSPLFDAVQFILQIKAAAGSQLRGAHPAGLVYTLLHCPAHLMVHVHSRRTEFPGVSTGRLPGDVLPEQAGCLLKQFITPERRAAGRPRFCLY